MVGLLDVAVHAPANPETFAGDVVDVTAVGIIASQTAQGGYLAVGYSHEATAELKNNVLVVGNPIDSLARHNQGTGRSP